MNIKEILGGIDCACGRRHTCPIEAVEIGRGAIARLSVLCEGYREILLVADENTNRAAGDATRAALGGKVLREVIFPGESVLVPDEAAIARVREVLGDADLIVGIGSGVIQDLCKYVSHFAGVPYMIVGTAPSMDGYASSGAAMILGGMKETVAAGLPRALIFDTDVLAAAPMEMIRAGYGDIIGKYSALSDWKLAEAVNGEYLCPYIYDTTMAQIAAVRATAAGLQARDGAAIEALSEALVVVGIMMSFAGSSRPASGSEHHLSHFFEIVGIVKDEPYLPHGVDVAFSTVEMARLHERLLASPFPKTLYREDSAVLAEKIGRIYGETVGKGCLALQERVGNYKANRLPVYLEKEAELRAILADMPSAEEITEMLAAVGLEKSEYDALYGREKIDTAIRYAKDLKDRYTVLWMFYDLFGGQDE